VVPCLQMIADADVQVFLMLCFYNKVITPVEAIELLREISSLLWARLRNYVGENSARIDAAYERFGKGGLYFIDIFQEDKLLYRDLRSDQTVPQRYQFTPISQNRYLPICG
jgi:hypothetical protein